MYSGDSNDATISESTGTPYPCNDPRDYISCCGDLVARLLFIVMTMLLLEEQLLGDEVDSECDCRNAEAREGALEAVPSCEGTGVSPCLTARKLE